jgi:hypothetical protein
MATKVGYNNLISKKYNHTVFFKFLIDMFNHPTLFH